MSQFQGTFKRYEKKYLLSENKYKLLRQKLEGRLKVDQFGKTIICNIYFDTLDYRLIRESLEKPVYKEKLRLRSYGVPTEEEGVYIELKKKCKGIVYKRREQVKLATAKDYLYYKKAIEQPSQIIKEIDWFLKFYQNLIPTMYISYNRIALYGIEDDELRVTFDSNILWRDTKLQLEYGIWGNELLEEGARLMEIKMSGAMPVWLSHILDELEIYPISFSKYGKAYQRKEEQKTMESKKESIKYA